MDPLGTDPLGTDPLGTDPLGTDPSGTDPSGTGVFGSHPLGTDRLALDRPIERAEVEEVYRLIGSHLRLTPTLTVAGAEIGLPACTVVFKLEQLQHAGSFKTRGAFTNLLTRTIPDAGVVAASGGNHGAAVAYAAMRLGIKATIFVPTISPPAKVARIRGYGPSW
jgi:threonine dehydratase